jgi:LacI family transcriptional regulator
LKGVTARFGVMCTIARCAERPAAFEAEVTALRKEVGSKTTVHHVAKRAGVSIATVSRALNGLPVSAENLARVQRAATDLGYVVNDAARSLRGERTMTIGVAFYDLRALISLGIFDTMAETVEAHGYALLMSTAHGDDARYSRLLRRFYERRVDGLICVRPRGGSEMLRQYQAAGIPVIALTSAGRGFKRLPLVRSSFQTMARDAVTQLTAAGHRKVGIIDLTGTNRPFEALRRAADANGLITETYDDPVIARDLAPLMRTRLLGRDAPTAVVAMYPLASRLYESARKHELSVPRDLSVVAIKDLNVGDTIDPVRMTSIRISNHLTGRTASELLLRYLEGERPRQKTEVELGEWEAGTTLAEPRKR